MHLVDDQLSILEYCCGENKRYCRDQGSNQGPSDLQSDALPTELSRLDEENTDFSKSENFSFSYEIP